MTKSQPPILVEFVEQTLREAEIPLKPVETRRGSAFSCTAVVRTPGRAFRDISKQDSPSLLAEGTRLSFLGIAQEWVERRLSVGGNVS